VGGNQPIELLTRKEAFALFAKDPGLGGLFAVMPVDVLHHLKTGSIGLIRCQFLPTVAAQVPQYVLQLLFGENSQNF
jgi:hypothetical protein